MTAGNRERVAQGLELVRRGVAPYVDKQMRNRRGAQWLTALEKADAFHLGHAVGHSLDDTRLVLRVITEERFFEEILPPPGVKIAQVLIAVADRLEHGEFNDGEAAQSLRTMAQLLRLTGARKLSAEVQHLVTPEPPPAPRRAPASGGGGGTRRAFGRIPRKAPAAAAPPSPARGRRVLGALLGAGSGQSRLTALVVGALALLAAYQLLIAPASPGDPYEGRWADRAAGEELLRRENVTLPEAHHLVLLEPRAQEGSFLGDLYYKAGSLHGSDAALTPLPRDGGAGYVRCRDVPAAEAVDEVAGERLARGRRLCVTTEAGVVALLTVRAVRAAPDRALTFDLRVWKGPKPD